ncbi:MAG TPA: hypothetical protein VK629_12135 [Steroidobacteraceae bacterium]|nr:hypothetical protein [Steroidobacteraceae bacterium]
MLESYKRNWAQLAKSKPGHRFLASYERRHETGSTKIAAWKTAGLTLVAVALLIAGAFLSLIPGIPGFVLAIPALGILGSRSRRLAKLLDRAELTLRHAWRRIPRHP